MREPVRLPSFTEYLQGLPADGAPQMRSYTPTMAERIPRAAQDVLMRFGMEPRRANTVARKVADVVGFTPVGAAAEAWDAGAEAAKRPALGGKARGLGQGAVLAALGAVPGGKAAKGVSVQHLEGGRFAAFVDGQKAGTISIAKSGNADFVEAAYLEPGFTGKRYGVDAYNQIEQQIGRKLVPSPLGLSANARPFWRRRLAAMSPEDRANAIRRSYDAGKSYGLDDRDIKLRLYEVAGGDALDAIDARAAPTFAEYLAQQAEPQ